MKYIQSRAPDPVHFSVALTSSDDKRGAILLSPENLSFLVQIVVIGLTRNLGERMVANYELVTRAIILQPRPIIRVTQDLSRLVPGRKASILGGFHNIIKRADHHRMAGIKGLSVQLQQSSSVGSRWGANKGATSSSTAFIHGQSNIRAGSVWNDL